MRDEQKKKVQQTEKQANTSRDRKIGPERQTKADSKRGQSEQDGDVNRQQLTTHNEKKNRVRRGRPKERKNTNQKAIKVITAFIFLSFIDTKCLIYSQFHFYFFNCKTTANSTLQLSDVYPIGDPITSSQM